MIIDYIQYCSELNGSILLTKGLGAHAAVPIAR